MCAWGLVLCAAAVLPLAAADAGVVVPVLDSAPPPDLLGSLCTLNMHSEHESVRACALDHAASHRMASCRAVFPVVLALRRRLPLLPPQGRRVIVGPVLCLDPWQSCRVVRTLLLSLQVVWAVVSECLNANLYERKRADVCSIRLWRRIPASLRR